MSPTQMDDTHPSDRTVKGGRGYMLLVEGKCLLPSAYLLKKTNFAL